MNIPEKWLPRSILCLRNYTLQQLTHDLVSGITAGLVALPLAMAFGIAPGVTPQAGLYTAVVGGFLISALGGSHTRSVARRVRLWSLLPASSPDLAYPVSLL